MTGAFFRDLGHDTGAFMSRVALAVTLNCSKTLQWPFSRCTKTNEYSNKVQWLEQLNKKTMLCGGCRITLYSVTCGGRQGQRGILSKHTHTHTSYFYL